MVRVSNRKIFQMLIISVYLTFSHFNIFAGEYEISKEHEKAFDPIIAQKEIQFKKDVPFYNPKQWEPSKSYLNNIPENSAGTFIDRTGNNPVRISPTKAFGKNHTLGFNETFVNVTASQAQIDGILILQTSKGESGSIDVRRSRIFRWDDQSKKFFKMPRSGVSQDGRYVWARITKPGDYTVIGLSNNPQIQATLKSICAAGDLSTNKLQSVKELCKEKFCGGVNPRTGSPSLPTDPSQNELCQKCLNLEGIQIPECDLGPVPFPNLHTLKWESLGPFNMAGVIPSIELDPNVPGRLYALADPGGLWVLDDVQAYPQKNWRPLTDEQDKIDAVRPQTFSLGFDGRNTIVYLVDIFNTLFRSSDGGNNWINLGTIATLNASERSRVKKLIVNPNNFKELYAATLSGLFVSFDGGSNWYPPLRTGVILDTAIDFEGPPVIYTAEMNNGVFKRNSQGTWEHIFNSSQLNTGDDFGSALKIALGLKNADGTKQTDHDRLVAVKVHKLENEVHTGPVYAKRNNETHWQYLGDRSGTYASKYVLGVNPHNAEIIIDGGIKLWKTSDGGSSWDATSGTHDDHLCVAFDPKNESTVYVGTDGGIYLSRDGGKIFTDLNQGLVTTPIFRAGVNGSFVLATIDHWHWWGSSDVNAGIWSSLRGHEWQPVYADPKPERQGRFYGFGHNLWRIDHNNGQFKFKYISYFQPWTRVATASIVGAIAVDPGKNSNTILVGAVFPDDQQICPSFLSDDVKFQMMISHDPGWDYCSCQGGMVNLPCWSPARCNSDPCDPIAAIAYDNPANPGQAYMMTYNGFVYRSIDVDGGQPFDEVGRWDLGGSCYPNNATSGVRQLAINNEGILFAISQCKNAGLIHDCNQIAYSDNGGQTWNTINATGLPDTIYHSLLADSNDSDTFYLSTQNGVYISYNFGNTWERWDNGLPSVEIMQLLKDGDRIYAVTYGRGLWYRISGSW